MSGVDLAALRRWEGRQQVTDAGLDVFPARALQAMLGEGELPGAGDPLRLPWHWLYFLETPRRSATGSDGHPQKGGFLPPVPLPRRMWAAGALRVDRPLLIGRPARRVSTVRSVDLKEGKSGALVFVRLEHLLQQDGRDCITEDQQLVYRDVPAPHAAPAPGEADPGEAEWERTFVPDPVTLFRFSALTYNGHRIHYDHDYAVREEHYPGLVVHGPLLATLLLELLRGHLPDVAVRSFEFRAMRPAFVGDALRLCGRRDGSQVRLWTVDDTGHVGIRAQAVLA